MNLELEGKRAIITGGTRGIGLAIAESLLAEGASVAICARSEHGVSRAIADLQSNAAPNTVFGGPVDVADSESFVRWLHQAVEQLGGTDIFIGNAAFTPEADEDELWRAAFEVDLGHCVTACRTLEPTLARSDAGSVVLISSVASVMAEVPATEGPYGAMKAAMISHAAQLAQRMAPDGVRVNSVVPGPTIFEGGVWDQIRSDEPETFAWAETLPALGRLATPREIAKVVTFLASPAASFVTGASWRVDGGTLKQANF